MKPLADLAKAELVVVVGLLVLSVFVQMVSRRINLVGLLHSKPAGRFDFGRLQLLVVTLFTAAMALAQLDEMRATNRVFFDTDALLIALGGSEGLYLVRKLIQSRFPRPGG